MRVLKHGGMVVACTASVALSVLTLFLCSTWLLSGTSLVQSLPLIAMSVFGSAVVALIEFKRRS
jgi:hypothetical protein